MALTVSPPPSTELSAHNQKLSDRLDADILRVRAEIESLTKRKNLLVSSLLSSTKVQSRINTQDANVESASDPPADATPLHPQAQHNKTNIHRLAYGVTSFPFTDPNPDTSDRPLLGVRFDVPSRNGRFEKAPYYVFLKRVRDHGPQDTLINDKILKVHHHTIPALVPLQDYEERYLPQTVSGRDEGYFGSRSSPSNNPERRNGSEVTEGRESSRDIQDNVVSTPTDPITAAQQNTNQDLHAFVFAIRKDLVAWQLRNDAISLLAEEVGLADEFEDDMKQEKFSLQSVQATAVDARFCRLVWSNGTVGRLRLTDDGHVDRAVVIGDEGDQGRPERMKDVERMLCSGRDGGDLGIDVLLARLEEVSDRMRQSVTGGQTEDADRHDTSMDMDDTT